jgi:hypothetical protein
MAFEWVSLRRRCGRDSGNEFGFRVRGSTWKAGELLWMRIGRLSNQIAGKVTATCIGMATLLYVTLQMDSFEMSTNLDRNTPTWISDSLTYIVSFLSRTQTTRQLERPLKSLHNGFQIQQARLVRCYRSGGGGHWRCVTIHQKTP